jgi:branched-subunit amino acid transport protein
MTFTILALTVITFSTRYLFLEKHLPLRLGANLKRALRFSGPAVLSAITAPILLVHQGQLNTEILNPYLWGGIAAVVSARMTHNVYATMIAGGIIFIIVKLNFVT